MKSVLTLVILILLCIVTAVTGCSVPSSRKVFDLDSIRSYRDIPGVTEDEIAAIEALKAERESFSYGHLMETEAFILPGGTCAGFTTKLCGLLTELFGIEFVQEFYGWDSLKNGIDNRLIDFTGELTPTPERMKFYHMSHPIAERSLRIFTLTGSPEITRESDINGLKVGFLAGSIDRDSVKEYYPSLSIKAVDVGSFAAAAALLKTGDIDVFATEGVVDPFFDYYDYIQSKEFFPLVYTPVSMTTADPELRPFISVVSKYIAAGGIDRLYELYKEGDYEYALYKLNKSFTDEEKAYLNGLEARNAKVKIALENDNYPVSFYNKSDKEFQGISLDVLKEVSELTGIDFEPVTDENTTWAEILDALKAGEISMVSQLLYSNARKDDFLWTSAPYATTNYALLSKIDYPSLSTYQALRARVGTVNRSAYEDMYNQWFPGNNNTISYDTQNEALDALERDEIDLLMASEYMLLTQTNYREKPGFKVNILFSTPMDSLFGFNKNERILCSIMDKAQKYIKTDAIVSSWTSRVFDYSKKFTTDLMYYLLFFVAMLIFVLVLAFSLLIKNNRLRLNLEDIVKARTRELERQTEAAQVASKAKSTFLASMSHEIRTPLSAIIGMSNIAKNSISDREKALFSINQILVSSHHLLSILNDVLDMSKIESGRLELTKEPFSLLTAHGEVSGIIGQRCAEKNIRFTTNIGELKDATLIGDKLRINQVLINLLGNAVKFTEDSGEIKFLLNILEETSKIIRIRFSVSDNGIGMSEKQISRLFVPFEQTDSSIAVKFGGTGLGLSISQNLVGMMGGVIKVVSKPGVGSEFYFELGFKKGEMVGEEDAATAVSVKLTGKRILIAEDIEINRIIIGELLSPTGAEVNAAENGRKAVDIFSGSPVGYYDLIFMDVQMPVLNGYESTRAIRGLEREDAQSIPIIAMTANAYKEDVDEALSSGMNGHLSKPIDVDALMKVLVKYIK